MVVHWIGLRTANLQLPGCQHLYIRSQLGEDRASGSAAGKKLDSWWSGTCS